MKRSALSVPPTDPSADLPNGPAATAATIGVVIPARNEAATIATVVQALRAQGLTQIWVVDNGSDDHTAEIAAQARATVIHEPQPGYGQACWQGIQHLPESIQWLLFCDADGSDDLAALPQLLNYCESADLILGDRRATATGRRSLTPVQNFGNGLATTLIRWGWGQPYHDLGPLRLIRRTALDQLQMRDRGFGWTVEMQVRAVEVGLRIVEVPVAYRPRQGGASKISGTLRGSIQAGSTILATLAGLAVQRWRRQGSQASPPLPGGAEGIIPANPIDNPLETQFEGVAVKIEHPVGEGFKPSLTLQSLGSAPPSDEAHNNRLILSVFFILLGCAVALPLGDFRAAGTVYGFWIAMALVGVGWLLSGRLRGIGAGLFWGMTVLSRLILLPMYPGDDVWRYLWEGYIQTFGFSPYHLPPNAPELIPLRTDWWSLMNHPGVSAIYPPITQVGFHGLALISPSVWLFKLAFIAADLGICWLLCRRFGRVRSLLYAWNPLILYSFAGGAHYDSWFLLPLVAAWLVWDGLSDSSPPTLKRSCWAAVFLGISVAIKWMSLPILAFLVWRSLRQWGVGSAIAVGTLGVLPLLLAAVPFCRPDRCPLIPTASNFVVNGRSAELIPYWVAQMLPQSSWHNWLYLFPLSLVVLWLLWRAKTLGQFSQWYLLGLLVLSPIVHAWYFTWAIPFAVASRNLGIRLVSLSAFVYFVLQQKMALGNFAWFLNPWERSLLWGPMLAGIVFSALQASLKAGEFQALMGYFKRRLPVLLR
ncbi:MAG: glycosyltransferase family 2 protein [Cyanobacteria bacterium P01_G01_bin.54]